MTVASTDPPTVVTSRGLKVGDVAKRTGLSVRTLHYYDEIGLLRPSQHTKSQHRLYGPSELARLQQIKSLRQLGFSLDEIRACLDRLDASSFSIRGVLELHTTRLRQQIREETRLVALLETLVASLDAGAGASVDDLIDAIESITRLDRDFTAEERREIQERGERLGQRHIATVEAEWPSLIARVRVEMLRGTDPTDDRVRALALRWRELVREFTGGNPSIHQKLRASFVADPERMSWAGLDPEIFAYVNRAIRAL